MIGQMMAYAWVVVLAAGVGSAAGAETFEYATDLSKLRDGALPAGVWRTTGFSWEAKGGRIVCEEGEKSFAILAKAPHGRAVTVEAEVTAGGAVGRQWKVAGVAVYRDGRNYWHAAMVESPTVEGAEPAHTWELIESLDGGWLANVQGATALPEMGEPKDGTWKYGEAYRMRLEMTAEGIAATARGPDGQVVWRRGYRFAEGKGAVKAGRPALDCGGLRVSFGEVKASVSEPVAAPAAEAAPEFPPYDRPAMSDVRRKATGFFRVERIDGVWWLIDPAGWAFYDVGTDHVRYDGHGCQKLGYAPYGRNMRKAFPREADWAAQTARRLGEWGFNTVAAGHSPSMRHRGLVHTEFISFGSRFAGYSDITPKVNWTGFPNVFHRRWEAYCRKYAEEFCRRQKDDPWLLGYFLDNELEWYGKNWGEFGLVAEAWAKPAEHEAKAALVGLLKERHKTIALLNAAWGADYASFEALAASKAMPAARGEVAADDCYAYLALVAERYFGAAARAIRAVDGNHLILGSRFAGRVHDVVWKAAGRHMDVVSCNVYGDVDLATGTAAPTREMLKQYHELCGRPMMLTEWSHPALDSGLPCTKGAGQRFDTQAQRAEAFAVYQTMLLSLPFMVGSHYFMWVDEPALGISDTFPENTNYGLVNERGEPYAELTAMAAKVNPLAVRYHSGQTAEVGIAIDAAGGRVVVSNAGKVAAACPVEVWVDGVRRRLTVAIPAGGSVSESVLKGAAAGAHWVVVRLDPDKTLAGADRADDFAASHVWTGAGAAGAGVARIAVGNPTARTLKDVVVRMKVSDLLGGAGGGGAVVKPAGGGEAPPQQLIAGESGPELALTVGELVPFGAAVFEAAPSPEARAAEPETLQVPFEIAGERLTLRKNQGDGDLIDDVLLDGVPLGRVQALIHQNVGQDLWLAANRLVSVSRRSGPVEAVVDFVAEYRPSEPAEVKTAVDPGGEYAPKQRTGGAFRVQYRATMGAKRRFFGLKFASVTNIDARSWRLESYFHFLPGHIGGSPDGDDVLRPDVPSYYGMRSMWYDAKVGAGFGAVAPAPLEAHFWLDGGGRQHPDVRRKVGRDLQPGETWSADEPIVWVFGVKGPAGERPWHEMAEDLAARSKVSVKVWR